ncbi:DNA-protecting protein DprA [Candidatus Saccharibacteria bacterium]|nr:DNA-protecting protein DprA [Candidatus Saccharibacteria bacterium]
MKVKNLKRNDPNFPKILSQIPSPPEQIFWLGTDPAELLRQPRVAIVGSRKVSPYGRAVTTQLTNELSRVGVVIVSGLALGVDSIAHQVALDAGGSTIAVLPTSLDVIYPSSHLNLARQIASGGGCILSEYPPGSEVFKINFIARNRLVSGLSDALLITEAAKNSGTMHTAGFALEQGKTVMAVPGNISSPGSEGCNNLIKRGATPVTSVEDIFFALNLRLKERKIRVFSGSPEEQFIFELIGKGICDHDSLGKASKLDGATLSSTLTMLEINGYIRANAGNWHLT